MSSRPFLPSTPWSFFMSTATASRKVSESTVIESPEIPDVASDVQIEAVEPQYTFEVLHRNVLLGDHRSTSPMSKCVTGDVARLTDGRTMARVSYPDGFAYADFASDPRLSNGFTGSPPGWPTKVRNEIEIL